MLLVQVSRFVTFFDLIKEKNRNFNAPKVKKSKHNSGANGVDFQVSNFHIKKLVFSNDYVLGKFIKVSQSGQVGYMPDFHPGSLGLSKTKITHLVRLEMKMIFYCKVHYKNWPKKIDKDWEWPSGITSTNILWKISEQRLTKEEERLRLYRETGLSIICQTCNSIRHVVIVWPLQKPSWWQPINWLKLWGASSLANRHL